MTRPSASDHAAGPVPTPVRRMGLGDQVYESLRELLFDQRIEAGERLTISQLASQLGVSPTPLREALTRLESEGLVVREAMRGYFLAPLLTEHGFAQLYEMRRIAEPAAAALAAQHVTGKQLKQMEDSLRRMERSSVGSTYKEFESHMASDAQFHATIAKASGNTYLEETLTRMHAHQQLSRLYVNHGMPDADSALPEHRAILSAIRDGDAAAAAEAMRIHLERSRQSMSALVRASQTPGRPEESPDTPFTRPR